MTLVSTDGTPCVSPSDRVFGIYVARGLAVGHGQFTPVSEPVPPRGAGL